MSPDLAPLVALLGRDPPPLKPVIAAADITVSPSLVADLTLCTTGLTVLETVVSVDVVVDGSLAPAAWATTVILDVFHKVPAIVVVAVLVMAGEGVSSGRGVGLEGMRGGGREELKHSYFNSVFNPVLFSITPSLLSVSQYL